MPVRSLSSSVLKWPDRGTVHDAFADWVERAAAAGTDLRRAGYFGSYATEEWGVGSDLDVVLVVDDSDDAFESRAAHWDLTPLPVPADVLVYTTAEWDDLVARDDRFSRMLIDDCVWLLER